jgi:glycerophosphoryl diester phosphodiesterase
MFLKIGHRGARAYEPENTLRSFKKALELGANAIEFDVRQTKDKKIVVIHDDKVDRTTNGKGLVNDLTLREIKELDAGKGERIPTLEEALDFIGRKVKILIELKETGIEKKVLDLVKERGLEDNVIVVSFLEDALEKVRKLDQKIETGLIYVKHANPIKSATELKANYLLPLYRFTHTANVQKAHENKLKVIVWTINNPEEVSTYVRKGVDGIASDKPDILKEVRRSTLQTK